MRFTLLLIIVFGLLSCDGKTDSTTDELLPASALPSAFPECCAELPGLTADVNTSSNDSTTQDSATTDYYEDPWFNWLFQKSYLNDSVLVTAYHLQLDTTVLSYQALAGLKFQIDLTGALWKTTSVPDFCITDETIETNELNHSLHCTFPDGDQSDLNDAPISYKFPIDHVPYESRTIKASVSLQKGSDGFDDTQWDVQLEHQNRGEMLLDSEGKLLSDIISLMSIATGETVLRLYAAGGPRFTSSTRTARYVPCDKGGHVDIVDYVSDSLATYWNYQYNDCGLEEFTVSGHV